MNEQEARLSICTDHLQGTITITGTHNMQDHVFDLVVQFAAAGCSCEHSNEVGGFKVVATCPPDVYNDYHKNLVRYMLHNIQSSGAMLTDN